MDLTIQPEIANMIMKKVSDFFSELANRAIEATNGSIDIILSASDIGTNEGMMISPELWKKYVKPWTSRVIEPFSKLGYKTWYHSDGDFTEILEDFIEMGLDIIDPIQPKAKNNDPKNLKARFGGKIVFSGGIDQQELLPFRTPEIVRKEVTRTIDILGDNGGYIVSSSNALQPDVPLENILSLFKTVQEYKYC